MPIIARLKKWLMPRAVAEEEQLLSAQFVLTVNAALLVAGLAALPLNIFFGQYTSAVAVLVGCGITSLAFGLVRWGQVQAASFLVLGNLLALATYLPYIADGLQDIAILLYPMVLIVASLLLSDKRLYGGVVVAVDLSLTFVLFGQLTGRVIVLGGKSAAGLYSDYVIAVLMMGMMALAVFLLSDTMRRNLFSARRNARALAETAERYRLISSVVSDYLFSSDIGPDGSSQLTWVSGAFASITGFDTFESYIATGGWLAHLHPEDAAQDAHDMAALYENHSVVTEVRTFHKDGSMRWVRVYAHPVWDEVHQRLTGIYGAVQDITSPKETEAREHRRQDMLEKVVELGKTVTGVMQFDECLRAVHQSVQKGLGYDRVGVFLYQLANETIQGAYGTDDHGAMVDTHWFVQAVNDYEAWRTALSSSRGFVFVDDYQTLHEVPADNEMARVKQHVTVSGWTGEKPVVVIAVDNALSQRRITDEQVEALRLFAGYAGLAIENARLNTELEQRVQERTTQLEAANRELESFSYSISHDLRAPLRSIKGFAQILKADYAPALDADGLGYLQRITNSAQRMAELIDDLLAFSRLSRHTLRQQRVAMNDLVAQVLENLRPEYEQRAVEFNIGPLPVCQADASLVQQVWVNLLSNALKYSQGRQPARIEVGWRDEIYFVRDNGVGFDMQYATKLFVVFQRLHRADEFEGTGVGLATVQRIVQRHGGRVWAESQLGAGATFYFTLTPVVEAPR